MGTTKNELERREERYHKKMAAQIAKKGEVLLDLDDQLANPHEDGVLYTDLRIKLDVGYDADYLLIVKRIRGDEKEIAFHYGSTVGAAVEGLVGRMKNGSLKWREDKPYEER